MRAGLFLFFITVPKGTVFRLQTNSKNQEARGFSFGKIGFARRKFRPGGVPSCRFHSAISVLLMVPEFL